MNDSKVFIDYTVWLDHVLTSRKISTNIIIDNFERLVAILPGKLDTNRETAFLQYLQIAIALLKQQG